MYNCTFYPAAFSADCKKIYTTSGMTIEFSEPFDLEKIYKEFPECKDLPVITERGPLNDNITDQEKMVRYDSFRGKERGIQRDKAVL